MSNAGFYAVLRGFRNVTGPLIWAITVANYRTHYALREYPCNNAL